MGVGLSVSDEKPRGRAGLGGHPAQNAANGRPGRGEADLPPLPESERIPDDLSSLFEPPDFDNPIDPDGWLAHHLAEIEVLFDLERRQMSARAVRHALAALDHLHSRAGVSLRRQFADARLDIDDPRVARAFLVGMVSAFNVIRTSIDSTEYDSHIEVEEFDMALAVLCWWVNALRPLTGL